MPAHNPQPITHPRYPLARIYCLIARCCVCGSRLRYHTGSRWRCANCGTEMAPAERRQEGES